MRTLRIAIAGGSIGGLFAASLLHAAGHDVTVYERSRHGLEGRGAGLVGQPDVYAILKAVGREQVADIGVVARERIFLNREGRVIKRFATPQTQLSWDILFRTFRSLLPDDRYIQGVDIVSAGEDDNAAHLTFSNGESVKADIVLGIDGIGSRVRPAVAGPDAAPTYAGYAAWRGLFPETELPKFAADTLIERFAFFDIKHSHALGYLVPGPDGSIAPGRRRYNWVWYRRLSEQDGALARALTDHNGRTHPYSLSAGAMRDAARDELVSTAESTLPPQFAAAVLTERSPFIQAICDYATPIMATRRIALLGDAAFVVRPHTAMGVSKAAGDALTLTACLADGNDIADSLAAYHAARRSVGRDISAYGRRLGEMFA